MTKVQDDLAKMGITCDGAAVHEDLCPAELVELALQRGEGVLTSTGSLSIETGKFTGRSPENRYIVNAGKAARNVNWKSPQCNPIGQEGYERVRGNVAAYLSSRPELFVVHGYAGADPEYARKVLVVADTAHQALFVRQMLVRPSADELADFGEPDIRLYAAPEYKPTEEKDGVGPAAIILNMDEKVIVVSGSGYCGEVKKGIFTMMNYLLPTEDGVLPMHCSANIEPESGQTSVLFGLSGTGKTTLSADPERLLIGDDEHGWTPKGVFNIEGGCYAKCIDLSAEREPDIYNAIRFGSVTENVILDPETREPDYTDSTLTENTRTAYPIEYIRRVVKEGVGGVPSVVLFLTADAYGVLPPVSKLDREHAMFHFLTGYTAKVAGTEVGIVEPQPTFSALFGEPFMTLDHMVYAKLLGQKISELGTDVYLVNTGWTGGPYGVGHRISLKYTRMMVRAAQDGSIGNAGYRHDGIFDVDVPLAIEGVPSELLDPRSTWADPDEYDKAARKLEKTFEENYAKRYGDVDLKALV